MLLVRKAVEGTVLRTPLDTGYRLSAGYAETDFPAIVVESRVYRAPEGPPWYLCTRNALDRVVSSPSPKM